MKVLKLDTKEIVDVDEIEGVRMIEARVAVEAPREQLMQQQTPETAALDHAATTAMKPAPRPRQAPAKEKRRKKRC